MNNIKIYVFNVGQGDHILLEFPDNKFGIIDVFHDSDINCPNEPPALTYLKQKKQNNPEFEIEIAFIHISHYHLDHVLGLEKILYWTLINRVPVYELWLPAAPSNKNHKSFDTLNIVVY